MARVATRLALCLALIVIATARPIVRPGSARRRVLQVEEDVNGTLGFPPSSQPCFFDKSGNTPPWYGQCAVNPLFTVSQPTNYSKGALADILQTNYTLNCRRHFWYNGSSIYTLQPVLDSLANGTGIPTAYQSAFDECNADRDNYCYVDLSVYEREPGVISATVECLAYSAAGLLESGILCPNANYTRYLKCVSSTKNECTGDCGWNTRLYDNDTAFSDVFQRVGGDLLGRGYNCLPKEAANLTGAEFNAYNDNIGNVTQRGNCSYARSVKRRIDYISLCSSFNNPDGWSGLMESNSSTTPTYNTTSGAEYFSCINSTRAEQCLAAGCEIERVPASVGWYGFQSDWFTCAPIWYRRLGMGYYNMSDIGLLLANLQCGAQDKQYNQTLCESTTLNFFTTP